MHFTIAAQCDAEHEESVTSARKSADGEFKKFYDHSWQHTQNDGNGLHLLRVYVQYSRAENLRESVLFL